MNLWRTLATPEWLIANEDALRSRAAHRLTIISRPGRKRELLEIACESRAQADELAKEFGGRVDKLSRDWLERLAQKERSKPLKIGRRLVIVDRRQDRRSQNELIIPSGAAFGTGDHVTTAMSLRLLEQTTRRWKPGWSMVDLGTGSGILALGAKRFGAGRVIAIDIDPIAISTAKQSARANKIDKVRFKVADMRRWKPPRDIDIVTANLFSELLIEISPKLKRSRWMVLSGILRDQETRVERALRRNKIGVAQVRRRGKWVAILANCVGAL